MSDTFTNSIATLLFIMVLSGFCWLFVDLFATLRFWLLSEHPVKPANRWWKRGFSGVLCRDNIHQWGPKPHIFEPCAHRGWILVPRQENQAALLCFYHINTVEALKIELKPWGRPAWARLPSPDRGKKLQWDGNSSTGQQLSPSSGASS